MAVNPSSQSVPDSPKSSTQAPANDKVQTGALPGGQPGDGVNTSKSAPGQSNVDAATHEGTEYGTPKPDKR